MATICSTAIDYQLFTGSVCMVLGPLTCYYIYNIVSTAIIFAVPPQDGTFIVRDSTKVPGEYSLSLWYGGGIKHLR